jgi:hypothetical protein
VVIHAVGIRAIVGPSTLQNDDRIGDMLVKMPGQPDATVAQYRCWFWFFTL